MKKNKKSLALTILFYFIIFSVAILAFLWIFQIVCLNAFYKISRTKVLNNSLNYLAKNYIEDDYKYLFDEVSINENICVELVVDGKIKYTSSSIDKKCMSRNNMGLFEFQNNFIINDLSNDKAEIVNPNFNNKTLVAGTKISDNTYLFVNTSLVPLDDSVKQLKSQFVYIAVIIIFISAMASYFISKRLSIPITRMNNKAKKIGEKDYSVLFEDNTNIIEIDELGNTLNHATKELAKTDELRRELMANVSHDLKTPLTLIRAYAEAAKDIDSDKKEKREADLNVIVSETERLSLLVNDILELSKLESNATNIELSQLNLRQLLESIINKFEILKNDGYKFIIKCDKNIIVNSDKRKLEQVIYNLVNNAINYAGNDKKVTINVIKNDNCIRVEIIDNGVGIKEENLDLIWDKYYKVDKTHKRNKYGTGLGLSIVKSICVTLNYNYGVISKEHEGTTFYFEIK